MKTMKRMLTLLLALTLVLGMAVPAEAEGEKIETIQVGDWIKVSLEHMEEKKVLFSPEESGEYIFYMPRGAMEYDEDSGKIYYLEECSFYVEDRSGTTISESFKHQVNRGVYCELKAGEQYTLVAKNDQYYSAAIAGTIYLIKSEPAQSIEIDGLQDSALVGDSLYVYVATYPAVPSERSLTWESSDESVIALDYVQPFSCSFICKSAGTATITAKTDNGISDSVTIEVKEVGEIDYTCGENATWSYNEATATLTISGEGAMYDIDYETYSRHPWRDLEYQISHIVIEEGITRIGDRAFLDGCWDVESIQIADSVTSIGSGAFPTSHSGAWTDVEISKNVLDIGWCAFRGSVRVWVAEDNPSYSSDEMGSLYNKDKTELLHVSGKLQGKFAVPGTVRMIGEQAFTLCRQLTDIEVPASVENIGSSAFTQCSSLSGIWVNKQNSHYASDSCGVLFNKSMTELLTVPEGIAGSYATPTTTTRISGSAFQYCDNLTEVILNDGIKKIEFGSFQGCSNLKKINIPASVSEIEMYSFSYCNALEEITFEGDAPTIGGHSFYNVAATVYYPANNATWTDEVKQNYGGNLKWVAYTPKANPYKITNVVSGIHVYWKAIDGVAKYGLWRSETGKNGTYKWVANPTVAHFTDTKVESGKTYYYKVTTMDGSGKHSEKSDAIGITYVSTPDISARYNKAAGVKLDWKKVTGATGYAIYRKSYSGNDAWVRVATISGNATFTWTDTSVKNNNGTAYKYTIRALAGSNMKTLSGCRNAGRSMVRLTSRTLTGASKASATSIKCSWNTSSAVTGYEVRFMVGSTVYKTFTVGDYKIGTKTFTGLKAGQTYKIQVRSYRKIDGMGFYSAWSTAKEVKL